MSLQYMGLKDINGPLVALEGVRGVAYDEIARIRLTDGTERIGRVVELAGDRVILQVFEGTNGISLTNTRTVFSGKPLEIPLAPEMLGRVFSGAGKPIDGLGAVFPEKMGDVNGQSLNPVARQYPRNYIHTGISSIDALMTLIRGQKLPIFSGSGLSHNKLAVQIAKQAKITGDEGEFAIVFAAMGVQNDVADYFRRSFEETGAIERVCMFLNLSSDPIIERLLTPLCALTAAEYLAFEKNMHILVIMTDMTSYAEALREFSSSKGEIPGRKGYPGYLYSNLAALYERAGVVEGSTGSVTQIPILTMPNDDITHPIPDLTAYITEGQIVFDRDLDQKGVYPGLSVLLSLSRLMKDGIGEGYTRGDHAAVSNQLFAAYAKVQDARSLASVIGEEELSDSDKAYMRFGTLFEEHFLNQGFDENRSIDETLDLGWDLLCALPKNELDRIDEKLLDEKYDPERAARFFGDAGTSTVTADIANEL
ncbi:MAG: V-type ATP synthase subunit B [Lachnospiraceae bacterium]|nr:V-type ATP synthase subunit B [Ruminococcus sp.]MCM1276541.1 V-type ATP synthase subunit B [Lachnospiraceae bacterium]